MHSINITLEPTSNPEFATIEITDALFPVGRSEPFFTQLPAELSAKLSRRHARIFKEQGKVYLTDLNSRNGTSLNGINVRGGSPEPLKNGDIIEFANELAYRVKLDEPGENTEAESADSDNPQLVLKPANENSSLDVIVIHQFPFLIARKDSIFEQYSTSNPEQLGQISRRHAVISQQQGELYLEDLGSSNGTEINGKRLDEHARKLVDGDSLSIGGDYFVYRVYLPAGGESSSANETRITDPRIEHDDSNNLSSAETPEPEAVAEHTMFVDSPTSFLDIFCNENDDNNEKLEPKSNHAEVSDSADKHKAGGSPGKIGMAKLHARQIGKAFQGEQRVNSRISKRVATGVAIVSVFALAYFFYPSDVANIKQLSAQGQFTESAKLANSYLLKHPQNADIEAVATRALINSVLPDWLPLIDSNEYVAALQLLHNYQEDFPNISTGAEYLSLLTWVTNLENFIFNSDGIDGQIDIFQDEIEMKALLDYWNQGPNRYRQILAQISAINPEFMPLQKEILSQVRQLRHSYSLYGNAVNILSASAIDGISSGNMEKLLSNISDTEKNYPRLVGLDPLKRDAKKYDDSVNKIEHADLGTLINLHGTVDFETGLFQQNAAPVIDNKLPDRNTIFEYQRALESWKNGDPKDATDILGALRNNTKWTDQVDQEIDRLQRVERDFQTLELSKTTDAYAGDLLKFRKLLKPAEDSHYINLTNADFEQHKDLLIADVNLRYEHAAKLWGKYLQAGGITSVMRIEEPVSREYEIQAGRLSSSLPDSVAAVNGYALLQMAPATHITQLHSAIQEEVSRQRSWIRDLGVVLSDELLKTKLELLPYPTEE